MRAKSLKFWLFAAIVFFTTQQTFAQESNHDSLLSVSTIGIFTGNKVTIGNFETAEVYTINDYCIALTDISAILADSLKGKKVKVTGKLKIVKGKLFPAKTSNNGTIYEPYKEPDKKYIIKPVFAILE